MNKEQIITMLVGLITGAMIVAGYFVIKNLLSPPPPPEPQITSTAPPIETLPVSSAPPSLVLNPDIIDRSSTKEAHLKISGQTSTGASVFIFSNIDEKIASADALGNFAEKIKLEDGENEITVTAFLNGQYSQTIRKNVTLEINQ